MLEANCRRGDVVPPFGAIIIGPSAFRGLVNLLSEARIDEVERRALFRLIIGAERF